MYAIIDDGGKQYKVQPGEVLYVELRELTGEQSSIEFDKVLFYSDDETTKVGQPLVEGAKVLGTINGQASGPKLHPMKLRRRKDSQKRIGHRQKYLEVKVTEILCS